MNHVYPLSFHIIGIHQHANVVKNNYTCMPMDMISYIIMTTWHWVQKWWQMVEHKVYFHAYTSMYRLWFFTMSNEIRNKLVELWRELYVACYEYKRNIHKCLDTIMLHFVMVKVIGYWCKGPDWTGGNRRGVYYVE